ncbi:hypothetical protein AVI51_08440 [Piscirickettsia salmonis]|nr:hypothetical protein AVI48_08085 [Piscirickettsia salmonis]ERL62076.1 hypothetical protein K661_01573 [Piscirickettsia salmonis LF-89 = ATCC VR-1361]WGZ71984.1 SIMPL domain-containing protein [Piscirickettsia salmonis EM-90]APS47683.1 hypothetical protein AVI49_08695 [Piscirickettsia salmonis]APS50885.1 hypothetical protein AVI50_08535 [Piscirickettsia salmonis]
MIKAILLTFESNIMRTLSSFILAGGMVGAGALVAIGLTLFHNDNRYVTVKGLAEKTVAANQATWQLRFSTSSNSLPGLYQQIAKAQADISSFLKHKGFKAESIHFDTVAVTDNHANQYGSRKPESRYGATAGVNLLTTQVQRVSQASQATGELVQQGVVITSSNTRYNYTDLNQVKPSMLTLATENAEQAAQTFAKNSRSTLKGIRHASQGLFSIRSADGSYGDNEIMKKVRVVATVQYFIR